jgi:hypothetical protein
MKHIPIINSLKLPKTNSSNLAIIRQTQLNKLSNLKQKGFGIGVFFVGLLVVFTLIIPAIRVAPSVKEYWSIKQAVKKAAYVSNNEDDARKAFQAQMIVDNIKTISPDDLIINELGNQISIRFRYKQPVPLYGNVSLLMDYDYEATGLMRLKN